MTETLEKAIAGPNGVQGTDDMKVKKKERLPCRTWLL